ncbi:DUF4870 domain-containing protein [Filobacillus milosensis]|nr:DUF4870 domain-containing protein [Filobacillus milosensis]
MNFTIQEKLLSVIPHIIAMLPIPLINIVLVYIYRIIVGTDSTLIENHTRNNINFQLSYHLYLIILFAIIAIVANFPFNLLGLFDSTPIVGLLGIGVGLIAFGFLLIQWFLYIALLIFAMIKALLGEYIKFPLTIRFLK